VTILIAINKIDKPGANVDRIKQELTEYQLVPEEWGGDTVYVEVSAKQRLGLEHLLEMILLVAEVQELKANPNKRARGTVIEAELDKGKGPVVHVLIQNGTLRVGDSFVAGVCFGRVRAMVNDKGKKIKEAGPSTPVEITGLNEVPQAGDPFLCYEDERKARNIAERRAITLRQSEIGANTRVTLDDLYKQIKEGEMKDLFVIIKGDVQGSVEALKGSLEKIEVEGARVKIIHMGAGAITESDIILASASNAIIIGFNVRPDAAVQATADQEKVDIRLHRVIYSVIEEIEAAMKGLLDPIFKEVVIGHAEVRSTFKVTKVGTIAGCMVTSGKITRSAEVRLIRGGIVVFEGKIDSLKRYKDDAKEVAQGYECGITLERYNDFKDGDIIEAFVMETVER
jgi:translation initiation factor IF-2